MSLAGRGVVVTRPRELAPAFAELLERRGARALVFPAIEIQPLPLPATLGRVVEPCLRALNIVHSVASRADEVGRLLVRANTLAHSAKQPVAVLLDDECLRQ